MHSSTSNSDSGQWSDALKNGLAGALLIIVLLELWVLSSGLRANVQDTADLWSYQRERVRWVDSPVILVGASRIQLDISLETVEGFTGRPVAQLAIDGQQSLGMLRMLVDDNSVSGTILVSLYEEELVNDFFTSGVIDKWNSNYQARHRGTVAPNIEVFLQSQYQTLSKFHGVELPTRVLFSRLIQGRRSTQIVTTAHNREQYADYQLVRQPDYYAGRVLRTLGERAKLINAHTLEELNKLVLEEISSYSAPGTGNLDLRLSQLQALVDKFGNRGGRVIFLKMPTDKLVRAIDEARIPVKEVWDALSRTRLQTVNTLEFTGIEKFPLADGAHLDMRQKVAFTRLLLNELRKRGLL